MFEVTSDALDRLQAKLTLKDAQDREAFRFTRCNNGWKLRLDRIRSEDTTFAQDGRIVLLLDAAVTQAMGNMQLDVRSTDSGPRLKLHRTAGKGR